MQVKIHPVLVSTKAGPEQAASPTTGRGLASALLNDWLSDQDAVVHVYETAAVVKLSG